MESSSHREAGVRGLPSGNARRQAARQTASGTERADSGGARRWRIGCGSPRDFGTPRSQL